MSPGRLYSLLFMVLSLCIFEKSFVYGMEMTVNDSAVMPGEEVDIDSRYSDLLIAVLSNADDGKLLPLLVLGNFDLDFFNLPVLVDELKANTICPRVICALTRHIRLQGIAWSSLPNYFREAALLAAILENADDSDLRFLLEKEGANLSFFNSSILFDALERNSIDARIIRALTVYARVQGMDWLSFPDYFREAAERALVFNKFLLIVLQGDLKGVIHALSADRNLLVHSGVQARDLAQEIQAQDIIDYLNVELKRLHAADVPAHASSCLSLGGLSLRSRPACSIGTNFSFNPLIAIIFDTTNPCSESDLYAEALSHLNDPKNPLPFYMRDDAVNLLMIASNLASAISYFEELFELVPEEVVSNVLLAAVTKGYASEEILEFPAKQAIYNLFLGAVADKKVDLVNILLYFPERREIEYGRGRTDAPVGPQVSSEETSRKFEALMNEQEQINDIGFLRALNNPLLSLLPSPQEASVVSTAQSPSMSPFLADFLNALSAEDAKKAKILLEQYSSLLSADFREAYPAIARYINGRDLSQLPNTMHDLLRDIVEIVLPNPVSELYFAARSNPQLYNEAYRAIGQRMPLDKIKRLLHLSVIFNRSVFLKGLVDTILNVRDRRKELSAIDIGSLLEIVQNLASQTDLPSALRADYNSMLENLRQLLPAQNTGLNHDTPPVTTRQAPVGSVPLQLQDANIQNQAQRLNAPDIQNRLSSAFPGVQFLNGGSGN